MWWPPCIEEMPPLVELHKKLGNKVTILSVSEHAENVVKRFVRDHNVDLLTVRDTKQSANAL